MGSRTFPGSEGTENSLAGIVVCTRIHHDRVVIKRWRVERLRVKFYSHRSVYMYLCTFACIVGKAGLRS